MNHPEQDQLLKELLAGNDVSDFRKTSLEHGLIVMRQQGRRRRAARVGALVSIPMVLALGLILSRWRAESPQRVIPSSPPLAGVPSEAPTNSTPVKIITDNELLALFPNRPLALIGNPGHQQLVFLDNAGRATSGKSSDGLW